MNSITCVAQPGLQHSFSMRDFNDIHTAPWSELNVHLL